MLQLLARANEVLLEACWLRSQQRALRLEAEIRASELGRTILRGNTAAEPRESGVETGAPATNAG